MFLPNRREVAEKGLLFVGNIIRFDPAKYGDMMAVRGDLGYGDGPIVLVTKGGTAAGRPLIDLCIAAYPFAKRKIPNLKMVIFCGPSVPTTNYSPPEGVEIRGFEPKLYEHIAASDLVITQAGHTTINETIALRKPFIYFPLEHHFDQLETASRCERLGIGTQMRFYQTTPEMLADKMIANLGKRLDIGAFKFNDGTVAASIINSLLVLSQGIGK
jgi:predicted glycosyltransferase